jgi:uncharacterized membrane protein YuzA (DUF378 family)
MNPTRTETVRTTSIEGARTGLHAIDWIALALLIIGGINWGLVGLFNLDVVSALFGQAPMIQRIVYLLVGLAALYAIVMALRLGGGGSRRAV